MFNSESREYLSRLLSFAGSKKAEESTRLLSENYDSLNYLLHIDGYTIKDITNNDVVNADYLRLVAALTSRRITDKFKNGKKYLQKELEEYIVGLFFGLTVETVYVIMLDENEKLISAEHLGDGTVNASGFLPRKLLDVALRKNAKSVILAHNHPCGATSPSNNDVMVTNVADYILDDSGIKLLHHYIVSGFEISDCMGATVADVRDADEFLDVASSGRGKKKKNQPIT